MSWAILAVAFAAFVVALLPTRRLSLAGWRPGPLAAYLGVLVALAVAAVFLRAGVRVVVPALVVLYVLPFIGAPEIVARTVARIGGGRPPRIVEGRARPVPEPPAGSPPEAPPPARHPAEVPPSGESRSDADEADRSDDGISRGPDGPPPP